MTDITANLNLIKDKINKAGHQVNLIAVSKTIESSIIKEAIAAGCKSFGENRIQEAKEKWPDLKVSYPDIELHLIGHLQSKKAKEAVKLFDVIQSLDSEKLAEILAKEMGKQNKYPQVFVQINIGQEEQKTGIKPPRCFFFYKKSNSTL